MNLNQLNLNYAKRGTDMNNTEKTIQIMTWHIWIFVGTSAVFGAVMAATECRPMVYVVKGMLWWQGVVV